MGSRYLVTGVQLGMWIGMEDREDRDKLVRDIEEKQFIWASQKPIEKDCKDTRTRRMNE